jgi:EH domain-containing protein 1
MFKASAGQSGPESHAMDGLRLDLVEAVRSRLTPVALKYGYVNTPLEDKIKWRPIVLIVGNYSSGKSTLINELLGLDIQKTGQAPTDDSFTVISHNPIPGGLEERDGMVLLNDPQYPFTHLKRHGQKFASHFRLKMVHAPILENVAIIDTPGMLDSVSEKDRGYNYQEVLAELASVADLILFLFDPHKAGTVRETYEALRQTLPQGTSEDRIVFVLNRIDECTTLHDLLRVYGTLCWNLSQMTGRKDIPHIYLTYSEREGSQARERPAFLSLLNNQRQDLEQAIIQAPRYRLDHLATYIETHCERLGHFLEALQEYGRMRRILSVKIILILVSVALLLGTLMYGALLQSMGLTGLGPDFALGLAGLVVVLVLVLGMVFIYPRLLQRYHASILKTMPSLTRLDEPNRRESWAQVEDRVREYLQESKGNFSLRAVWSDRRKIKQAAEQVTRNARQGPGANYGTH